MSAYPSAKALWVLLRKKKKAHDFQGCLFFKGEEGGWGNGGTLPLPFFLLWKKKTLRKMSVTEIQSCGF